MSTSSVGPTIQQLESALQRVGADLSVERVLGLAPLAVIARWWRNGPVEDWHVAGRLSDADMFRINSHMTSEVQDFMDTFRICAGLPPDEDAGALEFVSQEQFETLAADIGGWMINPDRELATGQTLRAVAAEGLADLENHVVEQVSMWFALGKLRGPHFALLYAAAEGAVKQRFWWGSIAWARIVEVFIEAVENPRHPHWGRTADMWPSMVRPTQIADGPTLRELLLDCPWRLDAESARWVLAAGIGYVALPSDC